METPTAVAAGLVLSLFGSALLLWCALELRLRHRLRAHGVPATARVVPDDGPDGDGFGQLDSAPLLRYTASAWTLPTAGGRELRIVAEEEDEETVLARPRGRTLLRRPAALVPGTLVQVAYDARRPSRVVLTADESPSLPTDLFWSLLGTSALAGGISLLTHALAG